MTEHGPLSDPVSRILAGFAVAILVALAALFFASGGLIPDQP
jgi:preprotein translocase subunit Sec61beta